MEGDAGADAVADEMRGSNDDCVEELDGVLGEGRVRERPVDIGGVAVAAQIEREHTEPGSERFDVLIEAAGVDDATVQQDERLALAALVVPGLHVL